MKNAKLFFAAFVIILSNISFLTASAVQEDSFSSQNRLPHVFFHLHETSSEGLNDVINQTLLNKMPEQVRKIKRLYSVKQEMNQKKQDLEDSIDKVLQVIHSSEDIVLQEAVEWLQTYNIKNFVKFIIWLDQGTPAQKQVLEILSSTDIGDRKIKKQKFKMELSQKMNNRYTSMGCIQ